jgi:hypothetical protein
MATRRSLILLVALLTSITVVAASPIGGGTCLKYKFDGSGECEDCLGYAGEVCVAHVEKKENSPVQDWDSANHKVERATTVTVQVTTTITTIGSTSQTALDEAALFSMESVAYVKGIRLHPTAAPSQVTEQNTSILDEAVAIEQAMQRALNGVDGSPRGEVATLARRVREGWEDLDCQLTWALRGHDSEYFGCHWSGVSYADEDDTTPVRAGKPPVIAVRYVTHVYGNSATSNMDTNGEFEEVHSYKDHLNYIMFVMNELSRELPRLQAMLANFTDTDGQTISSYTKSDNTFLQLPSMVAQLSALVPDDLNTLRGLTQLSDQDFAQQLGAAKDVARLQAVHDVQAWQAGQGLGCILLVVMLVGMFIGAVRGHD